MKKSILTVALLTVVAITGFAGLAHATHISHFHDALTISPQKDVYSIHDELTFMFTPDRVENQSDFVTFLIMEARNTRTIAAVVSNHAVNGTFTGSIVPSEHPSFSEYDGSENTYVQVRYDRITYKQSFKMEHTDPKVDALEGIIDALQKQNKILSTLYTNFWNQALAVGDKKGYDRGYSEGVAAGMASCLN